VVESPIRTRDHGEIALRAFGAEVERKGNASRNVGGQRLHAIEAPRAARFLSVLSFSAPPHYFSRSRSPSGILYESPRARLLDILMQMD